MTRLDQFAVIWIVIWIGFALEAIPLLHFMRRQTLPAHRKLCLHAFTVFAISMAMVMGPTPPGTGVI